MKLEECIVNRMIKNEENPNNTQNISEFRSGFQAARNEQGPLGLIKYLIAVGEKYAVEPYTSKKLFPYPLFFSPQSLLAGPSNFYKVQ
jgi:hypothetical protein